MRFRIPIKKRVKAADRKQVRIKRQIVRVPDADIMRAVKISDGKGVGIRWLAQRMGKLDPYSSKVVDAFFGFYERHKRKVRTGYNQIGDGRGPVCSEVALFLREGKP